MVAFSALSKYTKNINVLTTETAINNTFYRKNISGKYSVEHLNTINKDNGIFVTGDLGDELFGTNMYNTLFVRNLDLIDKPPSRENLLVFLKTKEYLYYDEEDDLNSIIDLMNEITQKCPVTIDTIHKYFWWLNFCLMWNASYTRFMSFKESIPEKTYFPFFATDDFQNWSINNIDTSFIHKLPAKEYLSHTYVKDICKQKRNKDDFCGIPMAYAITDDFKNIYDEETLSKISIDDENSFVKESVL
jgi:hypothetical protein